MDIQGEIYRLRPPIENPLFLAQLDSGTLMLAGKEVLIAEGMEKATGKKKTALKSTVVQEFLKQCKPDQALQIVADGSAVWQTAYSTNVQMGVVVTTIQHTTLEDVGILRLRGGLNVGEKVKGNMTVTTKDNDEAKRIAELFRMSLKQVGEAFEAKVMNIAQNRGENLERAKKRDLAPLRKAVGDTTVEADGAVVTLTTEIDREVIETFLRVFFGVGR